MVASEDKRMLIIRSNQDTPACVPRVSDGDYVTALTDLAAGRYSPVQARHEPEHPPCYRPARQRRRWWPLCALSVPAGVVRPCS